LIPNSHSEYEDIIFKVQALNNEPFLRRWIHTDAIAKRLRDLSAEGERLYQLYLVSSLGYLNHVIVHLRKLSQVKVNLAIFVNSHHARYVVALYVIVSGLTCATIQ
jgi:hypothetical protein